MNRISDLIAKNAMARYRVGEIMPPSPKDPPTDSEASASFSKLLGRVKSGDEAAINELLRGCQDYLLFIANHQLDPDFRSKLGASDVVQQTLIVACNKIAEFDGSQRPEFLAWLKGILVNDLRERHRHFKRAKKRQVDREQAQFEVDDWQVAVDSMYTPGTQASIAEESHRLYAAVKQLPETYQVVLRLRNWQQLSFDAIGKQLGKSAEAARKVWARAVVELERILSRSNPAADGGPDEP